MTGGIAHELVRPRGSSSERAMCPQTWTLQLLFGRRRQHGSLLNGRFECRLASNGKRSSPGGCL